ncbi:MAG: MBL fold metallo-hydrolase [Clostridia bacterium]|nr:MBL fold metallo-hydrolase [Clostridia bacterium]
MQLCPLCSGSSGNATYVSAGNTRLLIDAGLSCRRITELLGQIHVDPLQLSAILITHEHTDHIKGVNILSKRYHLPVYANVQCWGMMREQMDGVAPENVRVFESDREFFIGETAILPFSTYHDSAHAVGFTIRHKGEKAAVCTDCGHIDTRILDTLADSGIVLLEANHDVDMLMAGNYPYLLKKRILSGNGHLNNEDCGRALVELYKRGVKCAILGHLSAENNYPDLALISVLTALQNAGIANDMQVIVAKRDEPTGVFTI